MRFFVLLLIGGINVCNLWANTCDKLQMIYEFHNLTTHDRNDPKINVRDVECIEAYLRKEPLPDLCVPYDRSSRPEGVYAFYDLDGSVEVEGSGKAITGGGGDASYGFQLQYAPTPEVKQLVIDKGFPYVNRMYTRRRCDGSLPQDCSAKQILLDMHDFNRDGLINNQDKACLTKVILHGAGRSFSANNPGCAPTDDPRINYDINNRSYAQTPFTIQDVILLQKYILGMVNAYDLPNVKMVTDMHGCQKLTDDENKKIRIAVESNQNTFNHNVNEKFELRLRITGGRFGRRVTFSSNIRHHSMGVQGVRGERNIRQFVFTPETAGVYNIDFTVKDSLGNTDSTQVTINVSSPTQIGNPPRFLAHHPAPNKTYVAFTSNSGVGYSYAGEDMDGAKNVVVSVEGIPSNNHLPKNIIVEPREINPSAPHKFNGRFRINNLSGEFTDDFENAFVRTYDFQLVAKDEGNNFDKRVGKFILYRWYEHITNPEDQSPFTVNRKWDGSKIVSEVSGRFEAGKKIRMNFEYPKSRSEAPIGKDWEFSLQDSLNGIRCDNPLDATYVVNPLNSSMGMLEFTPSTAGEVSVCIRSSVQDPGINRNIYGVQEHRLIFQVDPATPTLALSLIPNQTTFTVKERKLLRVELNATGGTPGYTYRIDNILPNPAYKKIKSADGKNYFELMSTRTSGSYFVELVVEDADSNTLKVPITVNVIPQAGSLNLALNNPNSVTILKHETYVSDLLVSGGVGDPNNYQYKMEFDPTASVSGNHQLGIDQTSSPFQISFTPDNSLDYFSDTEFRLKVTVTDEGGISETVKVSVTVTDRLVCADGHYAATKTMCCRRDEIADPSNSFCVHATNSIALIDKQDFFNPTGGTGYPSLCLIDEMEEGKKYIPSSEYIDNSFTFSLFNDASEYFQSNCRRLAKLYSTYTEYHFGGDLNTGLTINDPNFEQTTVSKEEASQLFNKEDSPSNLNPIATRSSYNTIDDSGYVPTEGSEEDVSGQYATFD